MTWLYLVVALLLAWPAPAAAAPAKVKRPSRQHLVYFANTPNELNVYRVYGAQDGKTLMIMGGIQGDEPGGFLSADLYADISLAKGNLIVVPRANFYSIIMNHRGPDGDMNRQFGDPVTARRHKKIVAVLKKLISESDLLLNLHDGSGFFRPRWEGPMANPRRYGQSLIADTDRYRTKDGRVLDLRAMAERVLAKVNPQIKNPKYRLRFNNHRTASRNSMHKEQRRSATFYALTHHEIPAFGVETSKSLPNNALKVLHHNLVINAFMEELGILTLTPGTRLVRPELKFLVVSVNDNLPVVVSKGGTLTIRRGDRINVLHIEANYERGLTCDLLGQGSVNDLRQNFVIKKPTTLVVRKDGTRIGKIAIRLAQGSQGVFTALRSPILYFVVEVEGERRVVAHGEHLKVVRGDRLSIVEVLTNLPNQRDIRVNFKGFVPRGQGRNNLGEDRGHTINTAKDLLARYSRCGGKAGEGVECYRVVATKDKQVLGEMTVEVVPARLEYLVLQRNNGPKLVYHHGETIEAGPGERLEVVDLKTNVRSAKELGLALSTGKGRRLRLPAGLINTSDRSTRELLRMARDGRWLRLEVLRDEKPIGYVRLNIGDK